MNDCLLFMMDICDGCETFGNCCSYMSANSKDGEEILQRYTKEIEDAITPIKQKFKDELRKVE